MSLLQVSARQQLLADMGLYKGKVDGVEGPQTKAAYMELQKKYFVRTKDIDGKYGANTDTLLRNLFGFGKAPHFNITEFKCKCGGKYCTGYPAVIDFRLLEGLEKIRNEYGKPVKIKSGFRCKSWNSLQKGSSPTSRHCEGKAADIHIDGTTTTVNGRSKLIAYWYATVKGRYAYGNINGSHPNMGSSVHVDVK